jgi:hypothetical protein
MQAAVRRPQIVLPAFTETTRRTTQFRDCRKISLKILLDLGLFT